MSKKEILFARMIKEMSNEDIAKFFSGFSCDSCDYCPLYDECLDEAEGKTCEQFILDWLNEEIKI